MSALVPMPDFSHAFHGFHPTLDSALEVLEARGVSTARITVRMTGRGYPTWWVIDQTPKPGQPITPDAQIVLSVAGLGFFHHLPVGMWDKGGEAEPGTQEIVEAFDDPIQKAAHWIRQGARLFDLRPDDYNACQRWIALFGLNAEDWPQEIWYNLALLLPSLHRLAGREEGIRLALDLLLGLPLWQIRRRRGFAYLKDEDLTLLGSEFARLGVDAVLGDRREDLARLTLFLGPVTLDQYYQFQEDEYRRRLDQVLDLTASCYQEARVRWFVLDPQRAPRLGHEQENARLGINSHLGRLQPV
jgi:hypothetical protein